MGKKNNATGGKKGKGALIAVGTCVAIAIAAGAVSDQSEPESIDSESSVTTSAVTKSTEATEPLDINELFHSKGASTSAETEPAKTEAVTEPIAESEKSVTEKTTEKAKSTEPETKKPDTEKVTEDTVGGNQGQIMVWIPTNGGTKYHSNSYCSSMEDPMCVTLDEAIRMGFTACKRCYG